METNVAVALCMVVACFAFFFGYVAGGYFSRKRQKHFRDAHQAARYLAKFLEKAVRKTDVSFEPRGEGVTITLTTNEDRGYFFRFSSITQNLSELPGPNEKADMRRAIDDRRSMSEFLEGRGLTHPAIQVSEIFFEGMWEDVHRDMLHEERDRASKERFGLGHLPPTTKPSSN